MKKFFALLLTVATLVTSLAVPALAAPAKAETLAGGFDFYSVTLHYSTPIVVGYTKSKGKWGFDQPVSSHTISAAEFNYKPIGEDAVINQHIEYGENELANNKWDRMFYGINSSENGIDSSDLIFNRNYGISNIMNNSAIAMNESGSLYGVQELYDDEGTRNPNFKFENNYFIDAEGNKIDDNGFVIDDNGIWHNYEGKRVEPFTKGADGSYTWVSLSDRIDENGRVKSINSLDVTVELFVIKYPDGKTSISDSDRKKYDAKDRTITEADIEQKEVAGSLQNVPGTPELGTPLMVNDCKITKITIELDAMGTQLYTDVASDPQQKNEIIITTNDIYENVKTALDYVAANPSKEYKDGIIIGTAKSVTTKTELTSEDEKLIPQTVTSVEVKFEDGVQIPTNAKLVMNFKINENQPEAAAEYKHMNKPPVGALNQTGQNVEGVPDCYRPVQLSVSKLAGEDLPDAPTAAPEAKEGGCGSVVTGSVAVIGMMALAVVALKKKED